MTLRKSEATPWFIQTRIDERETSERLCGMAESEKDRVIYVDTLVSASFKEESECILGNPFMEFNHE